MNIHGRHYACQIGAVLAVATLIIVLCLSQSVNAGITMPNQNVSRSSPEQWKALFSLADQLPLAQRVAFWADLVAIDTEYVADPLGEGTGATPDPGPLLDFMRVDCVTYVEQVYALALSHNFEEFSSVLQRIRYRDGRIDYRWRNHYLVADWLPANRWMMQDVTRDVGGDALPTMTKQISRVTFFAGKGLTQYKDIPDEPIAVAYIPRERVTGALAKLRDGDLVIFVLDTPGIIAGHVGLARVTPAGVMLQHASITAKRVVTVPLDAYMQGAPSRFIGVMIARPHEPGQLRERGEP